MGGGGEMEGRVRGKFLSKRGEYVAHSSLGSGGGEGRRRGGPHGLTVFTNRGATGCRPPPSPGPEDVS
jgi:hypothetical protein